MYRCDVCGGLSKPNRSCKVIVTEKEIVHPFRPGVNKIRRDDGKWEYKADVGGKGKQIKREVKLCDECSMSYSDKIVQK